MGPRRRYVVSARARRATHDARVTKYSPRISSRVDFFTARKHVFVSCANEISSKRCGLGRGKLYFVSTSPNPDEKLMGYPISRGSGKLSSAPAWSELNQVNSTSIRAWSDQLEVGATRKLRASTRPRARWTLRCYNEG